MLPEKNEIGGWLTRYSTRFPELICIVIIILGFLVTLRYVKEAII